MKRLGVYLINLDRSEDRLKAMRERLGRLGLEFVRVKGVDGRARGIDPKLASERKFRLAHGKKRILPGEYGCYMSHVRALSEFIKSKNDLALILEDDMKFDRDFARVVERLAAMPQWDMVKLNGSHHGGNIKKAAIDASHDLVINAFYQSKSGAYLVNRRAAKAYLDKMLPMFTPLDHEFIKFWKYGIRGYSVRPFPAAEEGGASTIEHPKNHGNILFRLSSVLYKAYTAVRRAVYAAGKSVGK
ncbi:MAG: glycosyltransferase family 25 protein [Rickettsiales bacterium]|jgi:glycosyl transferase family 25|nr:glycosyltransferase family 25 protein [Rickettsiales bacterium]